MACPTDCSSCASSLTVVVGGFTGSCASMNGTWTFTKSGCVWTGLPSIYGFLGCQDGKWQLTIGGASGGANGQRDDSNGCPDLGLYSLTGYGICDSQYPEASISS